ncbi:phosphotransferase [Patescibacteria group bacterium]|nr:phosphotransferase [Patescibacteria group bacterium]
MITVIKQLHKGDSTIELVELDGENLVLRTAEREDISNERMFIDELDRNNIKTLKYFEHKSLKSNQLLVEYVYRSPVLADNLTDDNIFKWGELCSRIHAIKYDKVFKVTALNKKKIYLWSDFIKERVEFAKQKIQKNKFKLSREEIDKVNNMLFDYDVPEPKDISLLHCDLNKYNILIKEKGLYIFDKGNQIFSGDYLFDLASVKIALTDKQFNKFIEGYGYDFTIVNSELFNFYYLLRTIMRWPHPKKFQIKDVVASI